MTTLITRAILLKFMSTSINSSGIEGNPTVFYRLMPGSTAQTNKFHTFYLQQRPDNGDTWADIKVNHPLDYESIKEYNLTIRVEVSAKNMHLLVYVSDYTLFLYFQPFERFEVFHETGTCINVQVVEVDFFPDANCRISKSH